MFVPINIGLLIVNTLCFAVTGNWLYAGAMAVAGAARSRPVNEQPKVVAVKIRRGLYRLDGLTHDRCKGQIFAEKNGTERQWMWECYCEKCEECDVNGHPTLTECVSESPRYWTPPPA